MSELFLKVLNMSISATWLIIAVLFLRIFLKRAPKWICVMLWSMVAFRLLCPFTIESTLSLIPHTQIANEKTFSYTDSGENSLRSAVSISNIATIDGDDSAFTENGNSDSFAVSLAENFNLITIFSIIWLTGIFILTVYTLTCYFKLRHRIKTAVLLKENVYQSENVDSPFVLGLFRPRIFVPFNVDDGELHYMLAHEKAHIKRHDNWWKPLGFIVLIFHWFNPLVWLSYVFLCRDIEYACDEKVINSLSRDGMVNYSQTLLSFSSGNKIITACPLSFGETDVKERMKRMLNYKKPTFWIVLLAVAICVVIAICFLTDPKSDGDSKTASKIETSESVLEEDSNSISDVSSYETLYRETLSIGGQDRLFKILLDPNLSTNGIIMIDDCELPLDSSLAIDVGYAHGSATALDLTRDGKEEIALVISGGASASVCGIQVFSEINDVWTELSIPPDIYSDMPAFVSKALTDTEFSSLDTLTNFYRTISFEDGNILINYHIMSDDDSGMFANICQELIYSAEESAFTLGNITSEYSLGD